VIENEMILHLKKSLPKEILTITPVIIVYLDLSSNRDKLHTDHIILINNLRNREINKYRTVKKATNCDNTAWKNVGPKTTSNRWRQTGNQKC